MTKYVIVFDSTIKVATHIGRVIGPFDSYYEVEQYFRKAQREWAMKELLAYARIECLIPIDA